MTQQRKKSKKLKRLGKAITGNSVFKTCFSWLVAGYLRLIEATTRWDFVFHPESRKLLEKSSNVIICFWHGRFPIMCAAWHLGSKNDVYILGSVHRDARFLADALGKLGFQTVAGSSRHGGAAALIKIKRLLAEGKAVSITPDGPKGPRMRAKPGVIKTAQLSGCPIIPVSGSMPWARFLKTWDRLCLPAPFSRGTLHYGAPLYAPRDAKGEQLEEMRLILEQRLNALTEECDRSMQQLPITPAPLETRE